MEANQDGLAYLETLPSWDGRRVFDLRRISAILTAIGNPQNKTKAIHITGTNGKGTVCTLLSAMLYAHGFQVGQFASPHLSHVTERCIINGKAIDSKILSKAILQVADAANSLSLLPSYFETITAAFFLLCSQLKLDWMVVEVGLGGRLDATNTIDHSEVSAITSIDFDHTHVLGNSLREIAKEKAGIFRPGGKAFVGLVPEEAKIAIREIAEELGTNITFLGEDILFDEENFSLHFPYGSYQFDPKLLLLQAKYQKKNAALAVCVAKSLKLPDDVISHGLQMARWPGRVEHFSLRHPKDIHTKVSILLDVAHNPEGTTAFLEYLQEYLSRHKEIRNLIFVLSILEVKDWQTMLKLLRHFEEAMKKERESSHNIFSCTWIFTTSDHLQALSPTLLKIKYGQGIAFENSEEAFSQAVELSKSDSLIVVTGSLYLVGKIRPLITSETFSTIEENGCMSKKS